MKTKLLKSPITNHQSLSSRGFTLIELLVVIGVLGILAAALVATIDPVEQIKKAQDSNVKNTSVEYLNALIRYYATHQKYPWENSECSVTATNANNIYSTTGSGLMDNCTQALITEKELKTGFTSDRVMLNKIYVTQTGSSTDVAVCFQPTSRSQQADPNTKYGQNGNTNDCTQNLSGALNYTSLANKSCYWCAK